MQYYLKLFKNVSVTGNNPICKDLDVIKKHSVTNL